MKPYGIRDRIAAAACNWILRHVASERYRKMTGGAIRYGLTAAARDEAAGFSLPPIAIMCATCGGGQVAGQIHECGAA